MDREMTEVALDNLGGGAAAELFELEWDRMIANILDPNTEAEAKRTLTLKVTLYPHESREAAGMKVEVNSRLAGPRPADSTVFMGKRNGRAVAVAYDPRQSDMFRDDEESGVVPINARQEGE